MFGSIGPKDDGDTLLVQRGLVLATSHLQTHYQILSGTIEVYGHHHLVSLHSLRCHLAPSHQHSRQGLANGFLLADRHNHIVFGPVSTLNTHTRHQQGLFSHFLFVVSFSLQFQLLQRPSISLRDKLTSGSHIGLREEQTTKPHSGTLV